MVDKKQIGMFSLVFLVGYTIYIALNDSKIAGYIGSPANPLLALFWYFITNLGYIIIFLGFMKFYDQTNKIKEIIAGIAFVYAIDILGFPRLLKESFTTDPGALANADAVAAHFFMGSLNFSYGTFWAVYYIILPIALFALSAYLVGVVNFGNKITSGGK